MIPFMYNSKNTNESTVMESRPAVAWEQREAGGRDYKVAWGNFWP